MGVLGLIAARGGSKSIPGKNLALLAGKPLLSYTAEEALHCRRLDRVVLNTDDRKIAAAGQLLGLEVPFLRPSALAQDDTPILPVIQHAVRELEIAGWKTDVVVLLQPTSPLRQAKHIDAAVDLLLSSAADTVVTVVPVPHQFNPVSLMHLESDGRLVSLQEGAMILRRQDKPQLYARNGPAVLAIRRKVIDSDRLYGDHIRPLEMSSIESIDIDGPDDLALAEFWMRQRDEGL